MTAPYTLRSQVQSLDWSVNFDRFDHIGRTRWLVATTVGKDRTDHPLVDLHRNNQDKTKEAADITHTANLVIYRRKVTDVKWPFNISKKARISMFVKTHFYEYPSWFAGKSVRTFPDYQVFQIDLFCFLTFPSEIFH
jgi:hypothetical protein